MGTGCRFNHTRQISRGRTEYNWGRLETREDVRGVAGVALATPFFQDLFYMPSRLLAIWSSGHPVIRTSGHPAIWSSGHLTIWSSGLLVIWLSGHPDFWPSDHQAIRPSSHLTIWSSNYSVFWSSGLLAFSMPQKCPYWDIFGLPYCRLHQSQIPNVLPGIGDCIRELFLPREYFELPKSFWSIKN